MSRHLGRLHSLRPTLGLSRRNMELGVKGAGLPKDGIY